MSFCIIVSWSYQARGKGEGSRCSALLLPKFSGVPSHKYYERDQFFIIDAFYRTRSIIIHCIPRRYRRGRMALLNPPAVGSIMSLAQALAATKIECELSQLQTHRRHSPLCFKTGATTGQRGVVKGSAGTITFVHKSTQELI
ncbi:unnamed protein product [Nesidiocoris tenuis]|uniref:Uncharacterized protein n=1 Tax=Nesidiocoris tenuis TaxID=355587 RepID=A0A6H5GAT9_9HEMI|nr:unnamed protein product [Nesidiocoris tenuis]